MGDLEFLADLLTTGTVLGVDHTSDLAEVEEVLGRFRTARSGAHQMVTDTGLVEFRWRRDPRGDWSVSSFGVRLRPDAEVEPALRERYGTVGPVPVEELEKELRSRGFALDGYREPNSGLVAGVDADGTVTAVERPEPSWTAPERAVAGTLVDLPADELPRWLDRRAPDDPQWWAGVRAAVAVRAVNSPGRWRPLAHALDHEAAERGIDAPDEAAVALAVAVARARADGGAEELPTMDQAIREWFAAVPPLRRAEELCAGPLDADGIRLARRLRTQIHALEPCLAYLSGELAMDLLGWIRLRSRLLARS